MKINNQQGRSMVEMLGVLAIIGVLSVAGIAGYSKGMAKHKTNQIVEDFTIIHHNLEELYHRQNSFKGINNNNALATAISLGIFPERMVQNINGHQTVRHAGGGTVSVTFNDNDVSVTFNGLHRDAAMTLATTDFHANWVKIGNLEN